LIKESWPMFRRLTALLFLLPALAAGQADPTSRSWNQPVEPFRIAGNLYYVGASDIASYLVATPEGHVLLDGGFVETVPLIRESVKKLGFKIEDVKILLNTHAHYDHAAGLAELKALTGAKLHASEADAPALARGGKDDPLFGNQFLFPPVQVDRLVKDGDTVSLGGSTLTARLTPGHTPGCTTWTMKVDGLNAVVVCSTSVLPMMKLGAEPSYPGIADDYARTFRTLRALPCDLFLAAHASFFNMKDKVERLKKGEDANPFVDPGGYRSYLDRNEKVFRERLETDRKDSMSPTGGFTRH
jgi:metallo-beta-lactamase class B